MATAVIMPKQGQSVESCIITKWHKKQGDKIKKGDILFSYETDKASFDEEAKTEGTLLAVFFEEGDDVECLLNVCVIGDEGEDYTEFMPQNKDMAAQPQEQKEQAPSEAPQPVLEQAPAQKDGFIKISPRARALADKSGADIRFAVPSGANERVMERDVQNVIEQGKLVTSAAAEQYAQMQPISGTGIGGRVVTADLTETVAEKLPIAEFKEVKLSNIRRIIAKTMHDSLANSAQLTLNTSFDASGILSLRKKLKENAEQLGLPNITINDFITFAVSRVLVRYKDLNAHFQDDTIKQFTNANIGIACDTERGLMVPTLFGANLLSLAEIASKSKALTTACKEGTINPDLLSGATFTITNLGTLGVESFTPVINPPQTGILGVCGITERTKNGVSYPAMGLSITFDHRAIDGAPCARFMQELTQALENFSLALMA
ncbi:MAG: 2-oxo acid dehydrogenase subunit E2 [Firmicutes bacterium]|nr:2-oxo acid dehydrogenase subunit E2 [Bacillota bacterium]